MGKIIKGLFPSYEKKDKKVAVIIAAGGSGSRMGLDFNKLFLSVDEKPIIAYTIDAFEFCTEVDDIIIVAAKRDIELIEDICHTFEYRKVKHIVEGGSTRQESVLNGLSKIEDTTDIVLIHDGARPLVSSKNIINCIENTQKYKACTLAVPVKDTLKRADDEENINKSVDRDNLFNIQTPQGFERELIVKAHNHALENKLSVTDDCSVVEAYGNKVKLIMGDSSNIKLTTPDDYFTISAIIAYRSDFE